MRSVELDGSARPSPTSKEVGHPSGSDRPDVPDAAGSVSLWTAPQEIVQQQCRSAQPGIPNDKSERDRLRRLAQSQVQQLNLVPPLTVDELRGYAVRICRSAGTSSVYEDYVAIMVNNATWRETVSRIPYNRRLLLLPQCLRAADACPAPVDDFGLVCQGCGKCSIHHLQIEAERLGYAVLVAEGSALVMKMIETGRIEAIVGVSCMNVLERCFPHMEARAVPGLAIPLLQNGCANTAVDLEWVLDAIHLTREDHTSRLDLDTLKADVQSWFHQDTLTAVLGAADGETETIAHDWLARAGKRWRPYLTACVYMSLRCGARDGDTDKQGLPMAPDAIASDDLKKLTVAVECFHKASLVHDDIEDGDEQRYGQSALHIEYGTAVALNVGDLLLGEGYRLIGELQVDDGMKAAMLQTAAAGHVTLSRGQGAELCWARHPQPLSPLDVLDIFRQKTAPAFEVALRLGALYGGADDSVHAVLTQYSNALGIAYQIRDDLEDFFGKGDSHDLRDSRPSLVLAIAHDRAAEGPESALTASLWRRTCDYEEVADELQRITARHAVVEAVETLLEKYTVQSIRSLHALKNPTLKGLLRRVIGKIFGEEPVCGYCHEFETGHVAGRQVGTGPAA